MPAARPVDVIDSAEGETLSDSAAEAVCAGDPASVTVIVNVAVPLALGVPEITPAPDSVSPAGKLPEASVNVYPGVPPVALSDALYGLPAWAEPNVVDAKPNAGGACVTASTTIESVTVWLCAGDEESETVTLNVAVPLADGVPEITPPAESVNPAGRLPEVIDQLYPGVPPLAESDALYAVPLCAPGSPLVPIASADGCDALVTVSGTSFDAAPSVFLTCKCATAGCASVLPPMFAASVVEFTTVVGTAPPFTVTDAFDSKFAPWTITVTLAVPAVTTCGDTVLIVGLTRATITVPDPHPAAAKLNPIPRAASFAADLIATPAAVPFIR